MVRGMLIANLLPLLVRVIVALADPFLSGLPPTTPPVPGRAADEVGRASTYGRADDSHGQAHLACAPEHRIDADDHVCAHRSLRCGTLLLLEHEGRTTVCRVMDRGPFGKHDAAGRWFNGARERERAGTWVGILDLAPAVRAELAPGNGGKLLVNAWIVAVPPRPLKVLPRPRPTS